MKGKTITQHFSEAVINGHEWAETAMAYYFKLTFIIGGGKGGVYPTLAAALVSAFDWQKSPEGPEHWIEIHESISKD